jgi:hypothetical protein
MSSSDEGAELQPCETIRARPSRARERYPMGTKPISPDGGRGDFIAARMPRGTEADIDELARNKGLTRSQYVRLTLLAQIEKDRAALREAPEAS